MRKSVAFSTGGDGGRRSPEYPLIQCDDVCRLVKWTGPLPLWLTEFWVQQQICCDADDDESHDKHRHPIVHFPLPSGNPGA